MDVAAGRVLKEDQLEVSVSASLARMQSPASKRSAHVLKQSVPKAMPQQTLCFLPSQLSTLGTRTRKNRASRNAAI